MSFWVSFSSVPRGSTLAHAILGLNCFQNVSIAFASSSRFLGQARSLTQYARARKMCFTMNITLSVDEKIAAEARKAARSVGKSLNQLVREYLETLSRRGNVQNEIDEFVLLSQQAEGRMGAWKFDREEAHDRGERT